MTQMLQTLTKRPFNILGVFIGLAVVSSILLYSGCGMVDRPNTPTNPPSTPTPAPTPTPTPAPTPTPTPTPDTSRPTSTITSPTAHEVVYAGTPVTITGTASDTGGGSVVRVEVSVDGGISYSTATGTSAWSFIWTPSAPYSGPATIRSRAVDTSGNRQDPEWVTPVIVILRDTTPPTVTPFFPRPGDDDVGIFASVRGDSNEAMDPATVNGSTVELRDPEGALVPATVSYIADFRRAELDPTGPLSPGTTYTARIKGGDTDPRVKDVAGNALAADVTWTFTTGIPPEVLSTTPIDGASDIPIGVAPRATFSKLLSILSLRTSAVLLQDSAGNPVPFRFAYRFNDPTFTVMIVPQRLLQPLQTYTVTFKGGLEEPHVTDLNGTPLESDYTWSFTTAAAPAPMAIFAPNDTPTGTLQNDPQAVELGLKFRSDSDGLITGVRFYKGRPANGGEHVGHLWAGDGTLLGSATFNTETERGWQQALFQTPIPITANTTYVVSYFAPQGNYSANPGQLASSGVDTPPLHALQDGVDGGNGVFLYSPTGGFPTQTLDSTNYWVDVVFGDPALSPPQVLSTTPEPGRLILLSEAQPTATISATFSEPLDPASVNESTVMLTDTADSPIPFTISLDPGNFTVRLTPQQRLQSTAVTLKGSITDATGTPLAADFTWSFTVDTVLRPASTEVTQR
jgi:Domain of unknown function (DUF4082)/Bacterial Ig-like domain/Bacterial Ig domain